MNSIARRSIPFVAVVCALGLLPLSPASAATRTVPEAFGTLPVQTDVAMTPDGNWLAWMDHSEAKPRVIMFDLKTRKIQRVMAVPERTKLRSLQWNDNRTLLIILSETDQSKRATETSIEYFRVIAEDTEGGQGRMLPMNDGSSYGSFKRKPPLADLVATRTSKPHTVQMAISEDTVNVLLDVDTQTGNATVSKVGNRFTVGWIVDHDGHPVAREDWDWRDNTYYVMALMPGDEVKELFRRGDSESLHVAGLTRDASAVVILTANGHPHRGAWAFPLKGGDPRVLFEDANVDVVGAEVDDGWAVSGVMLAGLQEEIHWFDPAAQRRLEMLHRTFPRKEVHAVQWTDDGSKVLAKVETRANPPIYYLVDLNAHRADIAAEEYPDLAKVQLGEVREITYKARDGADIPAYLTLPPGVGKTAIPLVILPHGGPFARDEGTFDFLAQFVAAHGYAVLQPQFRGSTGFGDAFLQAGYRQYGGLMQDDLTDGVKAMVDQGIADAAHVCIVGASYGGYAALAGAAFTPTLYKCAVSINGLSDLAVLMRERIPMYNDAISASQSAWTERVGKLSDYSGLKRKSPINSIASITAPVMIIYGTSDGVVPNEQSERMAEALKSAGKPVEVVKLTGEDHWLSRTDTRIEVLRQLERFLKDHI